MKKMYEKPRIMFESFTLSTNIAGNCGIKISTPSEGDCAYEVVDEFGDISYVFTSEFPSVCKSTQPDGYNNVCYDIPIDSTQLFNS